MRKTVLFLSLALMSGMSATARSLSPAEALGRVTNQPALRSSRASAQTPVMTVGTADAPSLYVFNRPEGGWMIVAADDVAAPVIGYSDSGAIDPANLPEGCKFHPRCSMAKEICRCQIPEQTEISPGHMVCCHCFGSHKDAWKGE